MTCVSSWKKLAVVCCVVMLSSCAKKTAPDIIMVGDCEHGIVTEANINGIKRFFPEAQRTDVLIAGGCYQSHFIKPQGK